jgi:hypothetical protein
MISCDWGLGPAGETLILRPGLRACHRLSAAACQWPGLRPPRTSRPAGRPPALEAASAAIMMPAPEVERRAAAQTRSCLKGPGSGLGRLRLKTMGGAGVGVGMGDLALGGALGDGQHARRRDKPQGLGGLHLDAGSRGPAAPRLTGLRRAWIARHVPWSKASPRANMALRSHTRLGAFT